MKRYEMFAVTIGSDLADICTRKEEAIGRKNKLIQQGSTVVPKIYKAVLKLDREIIEKP